MNAISIRSPYLAPNLSARPATPQTAAPVVDTVSLAATSPTRTRSLLAVGALALCALAPAFAAAPCPAAAVAAQAQIKNGIPSPCLECKPGPGTYPGHPGPLLPRENPRDNAYAKRAWSRYNNMLSQAQKQANTLDKEAARLEQLGAQGDGSVSVKSANGDLLESSSIGGVRKIHEHKANGQDTVLEESAGTRRISQSGSTLTEYLTDVGKHSKGDYEIRSLTRQTNTQLTVHKRDVTQETHTNINGFAGVIHMDTTESVTFPQIKSFVYPTVTMTYTKTEHQNDSFADHNRSERITVRQDGSTLNRNEQDGKVTKNFLSPPLKTAAKQSHGS